MSNPKTVTVQFKTSQEERKILDSFEFNGEWFVIHSSGNGWSKTCSHYASGRAVYHTSREEDECHASEEVIKILKHAVNTGSWSIIGKQPVINTGTFSHKKAATQIFATVKDREAADMKSVLMKIATANRDNSTAAQPYMVGLRIIPAITARYEYLIKCSFILERIEYVHETKNGYGDIVKPRAHCRCISNPAVSIGDSSAKKIKIAKNQLVGAHYTFDRVICCDSPDDLRVSCNCVEGIEPAAAPAPAAPIPAAQIVENTAAPETATQERRIDTSKRAAVDSVKALGFQVQIFGTWVWVKDNAVHHGRDLINMGFRWSYSKHAWFLK